MMILNMKILKLNMKVAFKILCFTYFFRVLFARLLTHLGCTGLWFKCS